MNECQLRSKEVKNLLSKEFGRENVKVRLGRGTAYGWIESSLTVSKPINCSCCNFAYCSACREYIRELNNKVNLILKDVKFSTYCDDMGGYNDEFLFQVHFKQN